MRKTGSQEEVTQQRLSDEQTRLVVNNTVAIEERSKAQRAKDATKAAVSYVGNFVRQNPTTMTVSLALSVIAAQELALMGCFGKNMQYASEKSVSNPHVNATVFGTLFALVAKKTAEVVAPYMPSCGN